MGDVTRILKAVDEGDTAAAQELLPLVYAELRQLADHRLANEAPGHTLQATALVHEAYLRLVGADHQAAVRWAGRAHFFAAAAEAMRRILIDHARAKGAIKRGANGRRISVPEELSGDMPPEDLLDLNEALERFAEVEPEKAELLKLRFFGGLTMRQASELLGMSRATADRHWAYARAWLYRTLHLDE